MSNDYNGVGSNLMGCTYSSLASTYGGKTAGSQNIDTEGIVYGEYTVPKLCPNGEGPNYPPRYDTFSHGQSYLCGGYFNLKGAYPSAGCGDECRVSDTKRTCNGKISCEAFQQAPVQKKKRFSWW
jgi:hypothetical protein